MTIRSFDHVAIPIQNTAAMLEFYRALGFGLKEREHFYSVHFGDQKINFHAPRDGKAAGSRSTDRHYPRRASRGSADNSTLLR